MNRTELYPPQREFLGVVKDLWRQHKPAVFRIGMRGGKNVMIGVLIQEYLAAAEGVPPALVYDTIRLPRDHKHEHYGCAANQARFVSSYEKLAEELAPLEQDSASVEPEQLVILNEPFSGGNLDGLDDARFIKLLIGEDGAPKYGPLLVVGSGGSNFGLWTHFKHRDYATWELNPHVSEADLRKLRAADRYFERDFNPAAS